MRLKTSTRQKTTLRRVLILTSSVVVSLTIALVIFINLFNNKAAFAAPVSGDYRSNGSGNWNSETTWERFNGSTWVPASTPPTIANNVITIQSGNTVTITSDLTIDQLIVATDAFLINNEGVNLTISNGSYSDLDVYGTFKNAGKVSINSKATITFESGGKYQHNFTTTEGTIPAATWSVGSECEIIGYTTNTKAPSGLQSFYNFTWNCPAQKADINLNNHLNKVRGNFIISNTGSENYLCLSSANVNLNIGGDFIQSAGNFELAKSNSSAVMNITGNYIQSGGVFTVLDGNNSATINVSGNFSHTGGTITQSGKSTAAFVFEKKGIHNFTATGNTVKGNIDYIVKKGATLNPGTSIILGRNFTLSPGAGLMIGCLDGISKTGYFGNIQVSGIRSFSNDADYYFNGTSSQVTGNGFPSSVNNLFINNSANITLTNSISVSGGLTFTNGNIITGTNVLSVTNSSSGSIAGYSASNYIIGNLKRSVNGSGSYDFPVGTSSSYEFANINLTSTKGLSNILVQFKNTTPLNPDFPLADISVKGIPMENMLTEGFWSLTPDAPLISGTFSVFVSEHCQAHSKDKDNSYAILNRLNGQLPWTSVGINISGKQNVNDDDVTAMRTSLNVFGDFAIAFGKPLRDIAFSSGSGNSGRINNFY